MGTNYLKFEWLVPKMGLQFLKELTPGKPPRGRVEFDSPLADTGFGVEHSALHPLLDPVQACVHFDLADVLFPGVFPPLTQRLRRRFAVLRPSRNRQVLREQPSDSATADGGGRHRQGVGGGWRRFASSGADG